MNDESKISDDQLRLATSRLSPVDTQLDDNISAARDAFLSLGAALESAAGNFDEAALLARLRQSCVAAPVVAPQRRKTSPDWMSLILTGALAAAGLIAIVRIASDSQTIGSQVAQLENPEHTLLVAPPNVAPSHSLSASNDSPGWNDPLDDELALASATIEQFTSRTRGFDDSLLNMNDQLKALSQELTNETL